VLSVSSRVLDEFQRAAIEVFVTLQGHSFDIQRPWHISHFILRSKLTTRTKSIFFPRILMLRLL